MVDETDDKLEKASGAGAQRIAQAGGGVSSPISPMQPGLGGYQLNYRDVNYNAGIITGTGADWFGPLNPMQPTAPPDVKGRILDYPSGYNLDIRPRAYETISFGMLRNFADSYDLLRILIETRKDQMARLKWNIVPRDKKKAKQIPAEMQSLIDAIELFFFQPDKEHFWGDWLRMILEDLLVLDAPTIYKRKTYGGQLYALQPIDGGTIKRVIDDWAMTPMAPIPAYQQVLKGYPAVDYTTDELIYKPRNLRTHKVYGYGPVEQIVMTINIGMRRQIWQLESFTEGNIPEALIGTPNTWTPDQVRSFQEWFDMMLVGQTGERRRARFVPGDVAKGYVPTKPDELFGAAEEWMVRVMCYCFGVSPQPFVKMMNRATAESAQEAAAEEGLAPIMAWVKGLVDGVILNDFGSMDVEFAWLDETELDPQIKSTIVTTETSKSLITLNEGRVEMGLDPIPDCPEADRLMTLLPTGWVPFALTDDEKQQQADQQQQQAQQSHANQLEQIKAKGAAGVADKPGEDGDGGASGGAAGSQGNDGAPAGAGAADAADGTVQKMEVGDRPQPPFLPVHLCGTSHGLAKAGGTRATSTNEADPLRPKVAKAEGKLRLSVQAMLSKLGSSVVKQFRKSAPNVKSVKKSDDTSYDDWDIDEFMDALDLKAIATTQDEFDDHLGSVFEDTGRISLGLLGRKDESLFEQVNERALIWARDHAAMLVGKTKNPEYSLDDTTRDMIRDTISSGIENNLSKDDIADLLEESYAFSPERAETIASTEITSANSLGALAGYEEAKSDGVGVQKSWLVLDDGCEICQGNADDGPIDLDEAFSSGDQAPGAHPHCRCVLVPVVANDNESTDGEAEVEAASEEGDDVEKLAKADDTKSTLYVSRSLTNGEAFLEWAKLAGFGSTLQSDDLHVTVAFSREPVNWDAAPATLDFLDVHGGERRLHRFGDAVVLIFESPDLQARHQQFDEIGCSWDYPEYHCHVTVTYSGGDLDFSTIDPYTGPLEFGSEVFKPVIEDWEKSIEEQ